MMLYDAVWFNIHLWRFGHFANIFFLCNFVLQ